VAFDVRTAIGDTVTFHVAPSGGHPMTLDVAHPLADTPAVAAREAPVLAFGDAVIHLVVFQVYPLSQAALAQTHMADRNLFGKLLVVPEA
jgi:NADPH:quinone reductase-like Zn-dependent oxidoreductase